jgi:hypothetical protein
MELNTNKIILLRWIGRFGNRMFQYALGCAYAKKYNCTFYVPSEWEGDYIFKKNKYTQVITDDTLRLYVNQSNVPYEQINDYIKTQLINYNKLTGDTVEFVSFQTNRDFGKTNIAFNDLHSMYFKHNYDLLDDDLLKEIFSFNDDVLKSEIYKTMEKNKHTYDVIHLRRGDVATINFSGAHSCISKNSYLKALEDIHIDISKIIWISDDINERSYNIWNDLSSGHKWYFPTGEYVQPQIFFDFFPDFLTIYFARTIIRGNSAFSWWASTLSLTIDIYSPNLEAKPDDLLNKYYIAECSFIKGNSKHFMNFQKKDQFDDIILSNCTIYNK